MGTMRSSTHGRLRKAVARHHNAVLPGAPVSREGRQQAPGSSLRDKSPRGSRCCTGRWQHCGSYRACSKALLLLASPKGRRCAGRSQGKQQPPGSAVGSAAGKAGGGSCPAAVGCSPRPARGAAGHVPRPKNAEIKLTLPSSGAKAGVKESQGRGREAVRTRKAAASVVNISHFNCFNDTLRDGCATQRVP